MPLLGTFDITSKGWVLFTKNFRTLLKETWASMLLIIVGSSLAAFASFVFEDASNNLPVVLPVLSVIIAALLIAFFASHIYITSVHIFWKGLGQTSSNHTATRDLVLPFIWISLLTVLAFIGGTLLFIIPGLLVITWFQFGVYPLILDNIRGKAALIESKRLTNGRFFPLFGRMLLLGLVFSIFGRIADVPARLLERLSEYMASLPEATFLGVMVWVVLSGIAGIIGAYFIGLFSIAADLIFYKNAKETVDEANTASSK